MLSMHVIANPVELGPNNLQSKKRELLAGPATICSGFGLEASKAANATRTLTLCIVSVLQIEPCIPRTFLQRRAQRVTAVRSQSVQSVLLCFQEE